MAVHYFKKHIPIKVMVPKKPVTPFIAKHEKECSDCFAFIENIDPANPLGYCSVHAEPTMSHDECSAFKKAKE